MERSPACWRAWAAAIARPSTAFSRAVAARAMRTIQIDYARARLAEKRGSGTPTVSLDNATALLSDDRASHLVALDDALRRLEGVDREAGQTEECRYFPGLSLVARARRKP